MQALSDLEAHMDDHDLIRRLFAMMTARCEDTAMLAVKGQGTNENAERLRQFAYRIAEAGRDVATIAEATARLVDGSLEPRDH